ncbi:hypothetical protein BH10ACT1_BH10ACT1_33400 [soil metagenome]
MVTAAGEVDGATAPRLTLALDGAIAAGVEKIIVDVDAVTFFGCDAIRALIVARNRLGPGPGRVVLANPSRLILRMLEVLELTDLVE